MNIFKLVQKGSLAIDQEFQNSPHPFLQRKQLTTGHLYGNLCEPECNFYDLFGK